MTEQSTLRRSSRHRVLLNTSISLYVIYTKIHSSDERMLLRTTCLIKKTKLLVNKICSVQDIWKYTINWLSCNKISSRLSLTLLKKLNTSTLRLAVIVLMLTRKLPFSPPRHPAISTRKLFFSTIHECIHSKTWLSNNTVDIHNTIYWIHIYLSFKTGIPVYDRTKITGILKCTSLITKTIYNNVLLPP